MLQRLGCLLVAVGLTFPAFAAGKPGSISGYIHTPDGGPQMGAMVEVLGSAIHSLRVFTDENGFYTASGLLPGVYTLRVTAPTFLSQVRERIGLRPGAQITVNLTLTTLFDALQLAPARAPGDDDDWKWVLRSAANRPILRLRDDGKVVLASAENKDRDLTGTLSFLAGSASTGYGSTSDMSTGFSVEKSIFASGTVSLRGNVGYGSGSPATVLRAAYSHKLQNGSEPQIAFTMRRLPAPDFGARNPGLLALAVNSSDTITFGDILELKFGSELQTIQFVNRLNAFRPFGSVDAHLSPNTVVEYGYATSVPTSSRLEKGFDSAPADLSESGPHVTILNSNPALERARHHEVSLSRRMGNNSIQLAAYTDHISNPALSGVGLVSMEGGYALPDIYSETFTYRGKDLDARGVRFVAQRKLNSNFTATVGYEFGGALEMEKSGIELASAREEMVTRDHHSIAAKLSGTIPSSKTRWIASYRWTDGTPLTPVDLFNASPGQADPYLNVFLRQPIPGTSFLPGHMDAVLDLRNLLAQGYVPVVGQDGQTVYLVQSARAVRGGLAFTF